MSKGSLLGTVLLIGVAIYLIGNMAYMNLRPVEPILPGWEEFEPETFSRYRQNGESMLLEIYASWRPTCKAQHEAFEALETSGKRPSVRAIRVDFDTYEEFCRSIGINYTGALLVYRNGRQVAQGAGLVTPESILNFLEENMVSTTVAATAQVPGS